MMPPGWATHCPPHRNWYSTDSRKASPMPPWWPPMPTPFCTAAQRLSASAFSIFDMVQIGTINDRSWMAGSANAAVEVSIRTSKPSALSQPRMIDGGHELHPLACVGRNLECFHGLEGMQRQRAAGAMRPAGHDRGRQIGD